MAPEAIHDDPAMALLLAELLLICRPLLDDISPASLTCVNN
jgi:hypothetical protein